MIRSVIARLVKWYENIGATKEGEGKEQYWRSLMEPDPGQGLMGGSMNKRGQWEVREDLPGGEPGEVNLGEWETYGEIPGRESGGELPGVGNVEKLARAFDLTDEEAARIIENGTMVWENTLQSGEHEVIQETVAEHQMRMMGPLTWRGVDGWMSKQVVSGGRRWVVGVGWVKLRGRKVREVVKELRSGREGKGVVKGRRID